MFRKYACEIFTGIAILGVLIMLMQASYFDSEIINALELAKNGIIGFCLVAVGIFGKLKLQGGECE